MFLKFRNKTTFQIIILVLFLLLLSVNGDEDSEDDEETPRSCYKYTTDFIHSSLTTLLKCVGSKFKPANIFEYGTRFFCILKCVLQELGTITPEGLFDDVAAALFFEENFAPEVQEKMLPKVIPCFGLAEQFDPKEYWCKTYGQFETCLVKALVSEFLPFVANCYTSPIIGTVFAFFANVAPEPLRIEVNEELRRAMIKRNKYKCFNTNCTVKYTIEKQDGTSAIVFYDRNLTEISRRLKSSKTSALPNNVIS